MAFIIHGLGTAVPSTRVGREESQLLAFALGCPSEEQATWLPNMYAGAGIEARNVAFPRDVLQDVLQKTRHSQSVFLPKGIPEDRGPTTGQRMEHYTACAGPLLEKAARAAIEQADLPRSHITHLVTVSCTGFKAPGIDIELIERLDLPRTVERTHIGFMGCHGALNGLRVASALAAANPDACVLLCAIELCSLHYYYSWEPQKLIANALFADGAAALVGTADQDFRSLADFGNLGHPGQNGKSPAIGRSNNWHVRASGSCVFPNSADAMTWTVGDHGFEMTLSRRVPELIQANLQPWLTKWLAKHDLTIDSIASWAVHPGGPKILDAVEEALNLGKEATQFSRQVLAEHGNMSSPTILFILQHMQEQNASRPCVALGFGPGLTVEAALLE